MQGTAQNNGSFPILSRVLVVYGDKIGYAANLPDALANLSQGPVGISLTSGANTTPTGTPPPSSTGSPSGSATSTPTGSTTPPSPTLAVLLKQVDQAFADLQAAYASGDPARVGVAEARLKALVAQYERLSAATPTSPAPSASSTPR